MPDSRMPTHEGYWWVRVTRAHANRPLGLELPVAVYRSSDDQGLWFVWLNGHRRRIAELPRDFEWLQPCIPAAVGTELVRAVERGLHTVVTVRLDIGEFEQEEVWPALQSCAESCAVALQRAPAALLDESVADTLKEALDPATWLSPAFSRDLDDDLDEEE